MAKRVADTYLTGGNFDDDDDDETEEPGTFVAASRDVLSTREIKKARRRGVGSETSPASTGAFKGFTGFAGFGSGSAGIVSGSIGFNFGTGSVPAVGSTVSMSSAAASVPSGSLDAGSTDSNSQGFGFGFSAKPAAHNGTTLCGTLKAADPVSSQNNRSSDALPAAYVQKVKSLNESLLRWIDQHVRSSPCCILSPVFSDYERHLANLNKTFNVTPDRLTGTAAASTSTDVRDTASTVGSNALTSVVSAAMSSSTTLNTAAAYSSPGFFTVSSASISAPSTQPSPVFSFSASSSTSSATATVTTSASAFGGTTFTTGFGTNLASGFTFGTGGINFGSAAAPQTSEAEPSANTNDAEDGEEYVPPKAESVEIKEDDAFYTVRCKLFYMLNNEWKERGVGHLYLKPSPGDKTQLLIRSDNTLGNILLNISLTKNIPTSLQGKTNVSLSCVPNPPISSKQEDLKPVCMLLRVKTADDANELLQQLDNNKK